MSNKQTTLNSRSSKRRRLVNDSNLQDESSDSDNDIIDSSSEDEWVEKDDLLCNMTNDIQTIHRKQKKLRLKTCKNLLQSLEDIKREILRTEPNPKDIIIQPMSLQDKARLSHYYKIYKSYEPNTNEWLDARDRYNDMLKEYKTNYTQFRTYSPTRIQRMEKEENALKTFDSQVGIKYKILNLNTSISNKQVIYRKFEKLQAMSTDNDEYIKLKNWLNWATEIPYDKIQDINVQNETEFIKLAKRKLDRELYGMEHVKEQILLFLSAKLKNPHMVHSNLGLLGPPGCGKTRIARLLADIMDFGFAQISFGGVDKADFLRGHDYTYIGSNPGEIVKSLKHIGYKNGIVFLDELDKVADNPEIRTSILQIVDPSQNKDYRDLFLSEISIDLSHIWWVASMNKLPADNALADRWWVIEIDGYNHADKIQIITKYLLPKALKNYGLSENSIMFTPSSAGYLIKQVCDTSDKGVRTIEKVVKDIVTKVQFIVSHQNKEGELPFRTSFAVDEKLTFPVILTNDILDRLLIKKAKKCSKHLSIYI
jgi:ATP-dependent Lon protease